MPLTPGTRIGVYEVTAAAGAGGMGEVYRATDTSLKRAVALKVLPASVASDPERLARFQREAEVLAALNHPNIAAIFGLETSTDTKALVMEFVEGPTLADRIAGGPIPIDEALPIAAQIAEALEAAHDRSIIHRDLKPANVKVRPDGAVKVLDFGLAKADPGASRPQDSGPSDLSPTMTSPAMTAMGMILGTASYMAPEQARGRAVDRRVDIWAFGCVLYEMLTARRAFPGEDITDVIAAVITREPDFSALPASTPAHVRALLARCFVKDPKQRLRDIGEGRLQLLGSHGGGPLSAAAPQGSRTPKGAPYIVPALAGALVLVSTGLVYSLMTSSAAESSTPPTRLAITFPIGGQLQKGQPLPSLAYAPDGRRIVYTARGPEGNQLWMRDLNTYASVPVAGTPNSRLAEFSPDGKWIAFLGGANTIRKVPVTLGPVVDICQFEGTMNGLTWTDAGEIVFSTRGMPSKLWRVSADSGTPILVTEGEYAYPDALPGGNAVLATRPSPAATSTSGDHSIVVVSLADGAVTKLFDGGTYARYVPTGHIAYLRNNAIMAATFDPAATTVGEARVTMVDNVFMDHSTTSGNFAISTSGALAYTPGSPEDFRRSLITIDPANRDAAPRELVTEKRTYLSPRISPDGRYVAVVDRAWQDRLWVIDVARQAFSRLTSADFVSEGSPVWSPDSRYVAFRGVGLDGSATGVYRAAIDGTGGVEQLYAGQHDAFPTAWTPDGESLVVWIRKPEGDTDLMRLSLNPTPSLQPLLATTFADGVGSLSTDGRWIAYQSNRSGRLEVYVAAFPAMAHTVRVSVTGGQQPEWAGSGRRLYFRSGQNVMAVDITGVGPVTVSAPVVAATFPAVLPTGFVDPMPDGRLLAIDGHDMGATPALHIVLNWFSELRERVR